MTRSAAAASEFEVSASEGGLAKQEQNNPGKLSRAAEQTYPPKITITETKKGQWSLGFADGDKSQIAEQLLSSLGTSDTSFASSLLSQLADGTRAGSKPSATEINFALTVIGAVRPKDELEATLAAQMAAVHLAAMRHARMLNNCETIPQLAIQERTLNKLMRTYMMQMEALRKHRTGGEQKVIVKHVTVNEGGKAIVGNVDRGGGRVAEEN